MMAGEETEISELPADDKAYFESRGEKLPEKVEKTDEKETEAPLEAETDGVLDEPKLDKTVPLRALTESREETKRIKTAHQEMEKRFAVLEDRWNTLLTATAEPEKVDTDPEPDQNVDIFAHQAWMKRQVDGLKKDITERNQADAQVKEETKREAAVWNYWGETAKATAATTPDFPDAVKFMSEARTQQLKALGNIHPQFKSQAAIDQQINNELKQIVIAAAQQGLNAGEVVYNMAKDWGFKGAPKGDDGKAVETLAKNMEAETSLSSAGGSRPGGTLDAKAIADMSPSEFEGWYAKHGAAGFKKLQTRGAS